MNHELLQFIARKAYNIRINAIRMTTKAQSGHPTSVLSAADLVAALFFYGMRFDPQNNANPNNDRFILSKGHAAPVLYAVYAELGLLSEQELMTYRTFNSPLEGHPTPRFDKVDVATGSLGQGLGMGLGMALAGQLDEHTYRTWVLMGDSEMSEGSVWEAAELARYYHTDHLIAIADINHLGQTGPTMEGRDVAQYEAMFQAFGWHTITIDGHDLQQICAAYDEAKKITGKPIIILAKTIKGYGVELVEDKNGFHGHAFKVEEEPEVLRELAARFKDAAHYQGNYQWKPMLPSASSPVAKAMGDRQDSSYPLILSLSKDQSGKATSQAVKPTPPYTKDALIPTRKAYGEALAALGTTYPTIVSLDAEVKNSTFAEIFEQQHPERFFQCFVAEQNMISMGVGMAARGKIPFCSTFASFLSRAFDQIRMAGIGRANIKLVGSHAGISIGEDGPSQMGLEDIACVRTIPGSIILYPCDAVSTWRLVELLVQYREVGYLRTTRPATPVIYDVDQKFSIGGSHLLRSYDDAVACIVAAGYTVFEALKAHDALREQNILVNVIDLYSVKPIDRQTLIHTASRSRNRIITVEDHYREGGIGEAVAYEIRNDNIQLTCLAVTKLPRSGTPEELYAYEGIDMHAIVATVKTMVGARS